MKPSANFISRIENKFLVFTLSLLLLLSPIAYSNIFYNPSHVPRMVLISAFSIVGMIFLLVNLLKSNQKLYFHKIHLLIFIFLVWATLSITWTVDYGHYAYEIIPLWGLIGIFFLASYVSNYNNIKYLIIASIIGAVYASIIAFMQNHWFNPSYIVDDKSVIHSTFGFKNHFALYLDLIIPLSIAITLVLNDKKYRWLMVLVTGFFTGILLELHTRGSWLTLAIWLFIAIAFLLFDKNKSSSSLQFLKSRKYEILTILILSAFVFMLEGKIDETWKRTAIEGQVLDRSSSDRLGMYYNSLNMIKDHPVTGVGYGAFWKGFREYMNHPIVLKKSVATNYVYRLHSDPLQYFTELGIPGGIIVLIIFFYSIYMGFKLYKNNENPVHKLLILGLLMSTIACGIHSLIDFPLHKPSSAIQFWLGLGLLAGLYIKQFKQPIHTNKIYIILSLIITLLYSSVATAFHIKNVKGNYYHKLAMQADNCEDALEYIEKSIEEGGFYLFSHYYRVKINLECNKNSGLLWAIINQELTFDPTNIQALYYRGSMLLNAGYPEAALKDFDKIIKIIPHQYPSKLKKVKTLLALNKNEEAKKYLTQIINEHPDLEEAKTLLETLN